MESEKMKKGNEIVCSVLCMTYNHEKFIRYALDGFVSQKSNYNFEVIVCDDASTDNTPEIIKEYVTKYPDLFIPVFEKENRFYQMRELQDSLVSKARGRYIAMCEGDDYWTDPYKLQKQIDVMENNPEIMLCYTSYKVVDFDNKEMYYEIAENHKKESYTGDLLPLLLGHNFVQYPSPVFRKEVFYNSIYKENPSWLDYSICLTAASLGNGYYIDESTCCYRRHSSNVTSSGWIVNEQDIIHRYFWKKFLQHKLREYPKKEFNKIAQEVMRSIVDEAQSFKDIVPYFTSPIVALKLTKKYLKYKRN